MQIEVNLARAAESGGAQGSSPAPSSPAPSLLIQQALEAIARISKGFNTNLCTKARPEIGEHFFLDCHSTSVHLVVKSPGSCVLVCICCQ